MVESTLKFKKEEVFIVDYDDLNTFLTAEYGQEFCFCSQEEASNYTSKDYIIEKEILSKWDKQDLREYKSTGQELGMTRVLLTDLCNRDKIPEGKYIIKVSW